MGRSSDNDEVLAEILRFSIFRMLSRLSRCAPKPPRASVFAAIGRTSSSAAVIASGTALIQSIGNGRHFFAAVGVGTLAAREAPALAQERAPRTLARGDAEQRLHRQMRAHALAACRQWRGRLAARDLQQEREEIGAGKISAHRLDQPRIAIDQQRRRILTPASDNRSTARRARRGVVRSFPAWRGPAAGRRSRLIASPPPTPSAIPR